jgi:hypothetical protein
MQTRYAYPSLAATGCPAPITDWRLQTRPAGAPACALRNAALATDVLNNTAVPDAGTTEVNAPLSTWHNTLTTLFLGGKTQIQRAVEGRPTFATVWIGNMDALPAATAGMLGGVPGQARPITPQAAFQTSYDAMIADLLAGAPDLRGVLIGVAQVAGAPRFFPARAFVDDATFRTEFGNRAGGPITVHPNCTTPSITTSIVSWEILKAMQAGFPRTIACERTGTVVPGAGELGDVFIIDAAEQATLQSAINGYNTYIQQKANSIGFAYYDPNVTLAAERTPTGCIAVVPNPAAAANASPFGSCFSNDGVHPAAPGHRVIANALISVINQQYGTTLAPVP